jgi:hypothetical protein
MKKLFSTTNQGHANQNYNEKEMVTIKKTEDDKCWQQCGEKGALARCWWDCTLAQSSWRTGWNVLKQLKTELPHDSVNPLLGIYSKGMESV